MNDNESPSKSSNWINDFKKAAKLYHDGLRIYDVEMECDGYEHAMLLIEELDATGPNGRDLLIPLLDDPDLEVRVIAAGYMVKYKPELGLSIIRGVYDSVELEARSTAMHLLFRHENNDLGI